MSKLLLAFVSVIAMGGPTWEDYAKYNAHYTTLSLGVLGAKITCQPPLQSGNSKCLGRTENKEVRMLCPTWEYSRCEAWVKELSD